MKAHRYKLLLDENFSPRESFPIINNRHDTKHIIHDLKQKQGLPDTNVYQIAVKLKRLIVTFNRKHFEILVKEKKNKSTGVISVSTNVFDEQIDKKIASLLSTKTKSKLYSHFHHIAR